MGSTTYFKTEGGFGNRLLNYIDAKKKGYNPFLNYKALYLLTGSRVIPEAINFSEKLELSETLIDLSSKELQSILPLPESSNTGTVIHFRGRDFAQWKPHSIINATWYIELIKQFEIQDFTFVTDDLNHKTSKEIINYAQKERIGIRIFNSEYFISDWWIIFNSKLLICGPSTFSLTAGVLGQSNIILNRRYAQLESKSIFWQHLLTQPIKESDALSKVQLF